MVKEGAAVQSHSQRAIRRNRGECLQKQGRDEGGAERAGGRGGRRQSTNRGLGHDTQKSLP
jgi:hypothetical protein